MENIQVALRLRPLSKFETQRGEDNIWSIYENKTITLSNQYQRDPVLSKKLHNGSKAAYSYDYCFQPDQDNINVYDKTVKRVALSSLNGINGTVFMYGQTGSGKTYTMMGYNKTEDELDFGDNYTDTATEGSPTKRGSYFRNEMSLLGENNSVHGSNFTLGSKVPNKVCSVDDIGQSNGILILALKDIFKAIEGVSIFPSYFFTLLSLYRKRHNAYFE